MDVIVLGLIAWGNAPYYGGHDFLFYGYLGLALEMYLLMNVLTSVKTAPLSN